MDPVSAAPIPLSSGKPPGSDPEALRRVAVELEAAFLAEMLKSAGVGKPREAFGGGPGEDQFQTLLVREYAAATSAAGGIGLSEAILRSLSTSADEANR